MLTALDVLQMKEENVLEHYSAETQLGGTNLDFQVNSSRHLHHKSSEDVGGALSVIDDIVAIENLADVNVIASKNTAQAAMPKFAAVTRAISVIGHFTVEPSGATTSSDYLSQGQPPASHGGVFR